MVAQCMCTTGYNEDDVTSFSVESRKTREQTESELKLYSLTESRDSFHSDVLMNLQHRFLC